MIGSDLILRSGRKSIEYWNSKLEKSNAIQIPKDFPNAKPRNGKIQFLSFDLNKKSIKDFSLIQEITGGSPIEIFLAIIKVLLYRYTGQEDIYVGSFFPNSKTKDGIPSDELLFAPIRIQFSGQSVFEEIVETLQKELSEGLAYSHTLQKRHSEEDVISKEGKNQLQFPIQFLYNKEGNNYLIEDLNYQNLFAPTEILFEIIEKQEAICLRTHYSPDLFLNTTIERMAGHFFKLLESIAENTNSPVGGLKMLGKKEEEQLILTFNQTGRAIPENITVLDLFENQVKKNPNAIALVFENQKMTYGELHLRSDSLAGFLKKSGVKTEEIIPICLERSLEMAVAILAVLKANAAFIPVDPGLPKDRISYMIGDSNANLIIASMETREKIEEKNKLVLIDQLQEVFSNGEGIADIKPQPNHLSYIIYTSGSTGKPKGVMIEHQNLLNFLISMSEDVEFTPDSSMLSVTTFSFDIFYLEFFLPLINGSKVYLASRNTIMDGFKLAEMISKTQPTHMQATPSGWRLLLDAGWKNQEQIKMLVGGEALKEDIKNSLTEIGDLWNLYGPTETTIWSTFKKLQKKDSITIGKPIANTSVFIVSKDNTLSPIGVPGELCIGGSGVGRGYFNRPDLTSEKFIPNPFQPEIASKIYRTGDLAKWLPNGEIECLGRIDDQVKIRGYRIETGEIESVILQNVKIKQAAVTAKEDQLGTKRLVAYVVANNDFTREEIIQSLKEKLPEYMVPMIWVQMERLPLTFNGKINKKELPNPTFDESNGENFVAPVSENEKKLAEIWCKILVLKEVGIHNDFFSLGGHSLAAMRLLALVRKEMQLELQLQDIFSFPTIHQLSQKLTGIQKSDQQLSEIKIENEAVLSFNQERLWFIDKLNGSLHYHLPLVFRIEGKMDENLLEETFSTIIARHHILKTGFFEHQGSPIQKIIDPVHWKLERKDLSEFDSIPGTPEFDKEISELIYKPFDLENDIKIRASLIKIGHDDNILVVTVHHICSDGWSMNILKKEISAIYLALLRNQISVMSSLAVQYMQFALWQRQLISEGWLEKEIPFWLDKLAGLEPLQIPTDFPRPPSQSTAGGMVRFQMNAEFTGKLIEFGQKSGATLFMTLLSAFKVLLYKYSGQEDLCIGTPVAGRDLPELEDLLGFFINSVPIRTTLNNEMSFLELLDAVKFNSLEAFEHRQVPFEKIVEVQSQERDLSRNPIFQAMFVLQNMPETDLSFPESKITEIPHVHKSAILDLTFELTHKNGKLDGAIEFSTDLFTTETVERMISHFIQILEEVLLDPKASIGKLKMLTDLEINELLETFNELYEPDFPQKSILELFEEQVKNTPNSTAVVFENESITYSELDRKSNQLAHYLVKTGIGKDTKVPICMDRSLEMIIGIWGILKSGSAYVPVDPTYPSERIRYVLVDLESEIILTKTLEKEAVAFPANSKILDLESDWHLIAKESVEPLNPNLSPEDLAYIIYTSGSTGQPKGVLIEHGGLSTSTLSRISFYKTMGVSLLVPSFAFDSSVAVIFGTLLTGGRLILCRSEEIKNPYHIKNLIQETEDLLCVPSYYRFLLDEGLLKDAALKRVILAGENLDEKLVKQHFLSKPSVQLFNEYGPTEGTVWATVTKIFPETKKVTIGKPIANTKVYILGKNGEIQPIGIPGELCISGKGISRGYLNRPELNAKKFEQNSFSTDKDSRMYRTGDLAKWLPDGNIEYLGRLDDQVKIRGFRIELGEIESTLGDLEGVKESVVILREDEPGEKILVAYIVADETLSRKNESQRLGQIKSVLKKTLPDYMIPNEWVFLEKLPLTPNNKIDRKNLPKPEKEKITQSPPTTENEKLVAKIWSQCLKKEHLDIRSDFFEIGGHSLLAVKMMSLLEKETGTKYPLNTIFTNSVLSEFAKYMDTYNPDESEWSALVPIKTSGTKPPLYMVHGIGSTASYYFRLSEHIDEDQPLYGFQALGINGIDTPHQSVEEMAAHYNSLILKSNPDGPYVIGGYSFGAAVAFEMVAQLLSSGKIVSKLIIFDTPTEIFRSDLPKSKKLEIRIKTLLTDYFIFSFKEPKAFFEKKVRSYRGKFEKLMKRKNKEVQNKPLNQKDAITKVVENNFKIMRMYTIKYCPIHIYLFQTSYQNFYVEERKYFGWKPYTKGVTVVPVPGYHDSMFVKTEHLKVLAKRIKEILEEDQ